MSATEVLGYLASLLVLATFCMRDMAALRLLAIASNLAFIGYAALADIHPVLVLHAVLLPMNACRLVEALKRRAERTTRGNDHPAGSPSSGERHQRPRESTAA